MKKIKLLIVLLASLFLMSGCQHLMKMGGVDVAKKEVRDFLVVQMTGSAEMKIKGDGLKLEDKWIPIYEGTVLENETEFITSSQNSWVEICDMTEKKCTIIFPFSHVIIFDNVFWVNTGRIMPVEQAIQQGFKSKAPWYKNSQIQEKDLKSNKNIN